MNDCIKSFNEHTSQYYICLFQAFEQFGWSLRRILIFFINGCTVSPQIISLKFPRSRICQEGGVRLLTFYGFVFSCAMYTSQIFQSALRNNLHLKYVKPIFPQFYWVFVDSGAWHGSYCLHFSISAEFNNLPSKAFLKHCLPID